MWGRNENLGQKGRDIRAVWENRNSGFVKNHVWFAEEEGG
jgi:hypothetical protein